MCVCVCVIKMIFNQWTIVLILFRFVVGDSGINSDSWDDVHMICPNQCVCKESPYMDLSVARWIEKLRGHNYETDRSDASLETNDAYFDGDTSHLNNPKLKLVMCLLQGFGNFSVSILSLPQDVQALVLLHNGNGNSNFTVSSSELLQLPDLEILEIRGTGSNRNLIFDINETMPKIKYANFELIELIADGNLNKKYITHQQHPSDIYEYVPKNDRSAYNITLQIEENIEIVPYDVYIQEKHNSQRATFIGWNNLEILRIHDCQLDEVYWEMFDGLVKLQHLSLENNDIKVVPPFAFYGALNVKSLSLARNNILDMNYRALAGLLELEYLDLSSNNLTKLSELTFPPFPNLKSVILRENPIEFILPMTFGIMNGTSELSLGSESVALDLTNSNGAFLALDNLISLTLWNITASGFYQSSFTGLKNLQRLRLRGSLVKIEYDAFSEMPQMIELILSECNISEISMDAFYGVKALRIVDMSSNQLTSIPPGLFDEQNQLQEIYLQKNRLKHLPKDFFALSSLKLVRLIKNPWSCTCEMSDWKQELTNSVRVGILSKNSVNENCIRNPKTGEIQHCSGPIDKVPEYTYRFDNRMSPVCSEMKKRKRSVYYALRHTVKCATKPLKTVKRDQFKETGMIKSVQIEESINPRPVESWEAQQRLAKSQRKAQRQQKMKRTLNRNAKILREEFHSQPVVDNQP